MRVAGAALALLLCPLLLCLNVALPQAQSTLPQRLTDVEFWKMFTELSEPGGEYPYENFVTNEETIQDVMPALTRVTRPGGVKA